MTRSTPATTSKPGGHAPSVLTIDLNAIVANWQLLRDMVAPAVCAGVVKANAYGLGATVVGPALAAAGCTQFFVAYPDEGIELRKVLPNARIAVLDGLFDDAEDDLIAHNLTPILNHLGEVERWQSECHRRGRALPAFIHFDTGMNRLGLGPDETERLIAEPERLEGIAVAATMSHFARSDEANEPMNEEQAARYAAIRKRLPHVPGCLANSSGIFRSSAYHLDMVRPGCALYGMNPTPETANPMQGVFTLQARILQVRSVDRGMTVGYGATHSIDRRGRVATLSVGYADGYMRSLSGRGAVFIEGHAAPVLGRVSMDLLTIDVTNVPEHLAQPGAWAEVMGPNRPVDTVAAEGGTLGYEILTSLGPRYQRAYLPFEAT